MPSPKPPVSPLGLLSPRWLESKQGTPAGPVIVHCSAGIGRTGCFIAICIGINHLLGENCVDILGIVCRMRYDRWAFISIYAVIPCLSSVHINKKCFLNLFRTWACKLWLRFNIIWLYIFYIKQLKAISIVSCSFVFINLKIALCFRS